MPEADLGDVTLHYRDEGHGPPVVLVHGGMGSSEDWAHQARALAPAHRVLRVDLRGHGGSTRFGTPACPWRTLDVDTLADDLHRFLDQVTPDEPAHLVGASLGSLLAQRVATEAPHRVRTLTSLSSPPVNSEALRQFNRTARARLPPAKVQARYAEVHGEPYWRELRDHLLAYLGEMEDDVFPQALLRGFKGAAWVVEASDDPAYSPVGTAFWYAWLPQARLDRPAGGHWLYMDGAGAEWFTPRLLRFLQEGDPGA